MKKMNRKSSLLVLGVLLVASLAIGLSEARITVGATNVTYSYTANLTDARAIGDAFIWAYHDEVTKLNASGTLTTSNYVDMKVSGYIQEVNSAYQAYLYAQTKPAAVVVSLT
jgi:hypothetical protein